MKTTIQAAVENRNLEIKEGDPNDAMFNSRLGLQILLDKTFAKGVEFANTWYPFDEKNLPEHYVRVNTLDIHGETISFKFTGHCDIKSSAKAMGFTHWKPIIIK